MLLKKTWKCGQKKTPNKYVHKETAVTQDNDEPPRYEIDDDTKQMLEAALNMVSQTATIQISEEGAAGLINLCDDLAHAFYIDTKIIEVVDEDYPDDDDPQTMTVYLTREKKKRPSLKLIKGDLSEDPPSDDDIQH